jgi:hypothetical protein
VEDEQAGQLMQFWMILTWINARMNGCWNLKAPEMLTLKNLYGVRIMHTYEKAPGGSRQSPGFTGFFAIICLFASIFLVWALMRTSLVKTSLEMMSSPPVTTGMASNAPVNSVAKP